TGYELWKSDGTADSTSLVGDINPGSASASPTSLANVNGRLFFSAYDGIHGQELWTLVDSPTLNVGGFPATVTPGLAGSFTTPAWDAYGNRATGDTGTVGFTGSDTKAVLPGNYGFTAADAGTHTFSAVLKTAGTQSLTATDAANAAVAGAQSVTVKPAVASRLVQSAPASVNSNA